MGADDLSVWVIVIIIGVIITPSFYQMNKRIRRLEEQVRHLSDERKNL
ncbi:hypothetical protein P4H27_09220 [Paenibacillus taichungensis]|nr:hypothetical protein [Paenibacillus taichungensis]MEC0107115.1 hypothetical protein [Paenibacillus taichungensis]MEC0194953.1 hypothetical protein [Paenibacillus taichungensis]